MSSESFASVRRTIEIRATPERVFAALTEPKDLTQWFAQHTIVDPQPGGRYAFWGDRTPGVRDALAARQTIESWSPPTGLSFRYEVAEAPALATYALSPSGAGTTAVLRIDLPGNERSLPYYLAMDTTATWLYNLRSYVETGAPACIGRYTGHSDRMSLTITVEAPADDVFRALVDPDRLKLWIGGDPVVDAEKGGTYVYGWTEKDATGEEVAVGPTKLIDIDPGKRIVHDWFYVGEQPSTAEWTIEAEGGQSVLTITHWGFGPEDGVENYVGGWASFLCRLKSVVERRPLALLDQPAEKAT